jgi:hypothetical protein
MARGASEFEGVNHRGPRDRGCDARCLRVGGARERGIERPIPGWRA